MAKNYGAEYPERPLMAIVSDLLGIGHFTTSRGSTVRRDFLEAVCAALGVDRGAVQAADKDGVLRLAVEAATGRPMPDVLLSRGATVTNEALQAMIGGITARLESEAPPPSVSPGDESRSIVDDELVIVAERVRRLREEAVRQGQSSFRRRLLDAYGGRCAISGADAVQVLDAAHIIPFSGRGSDSTQNGLLLRADLHRLFDAASISVDGDHRVLVADYLRPTTYGDLEGVPLRLPRRPEDRPSSEALRMHRAAAGLG